uniref:Battenin n=1 Tax=Setaria digitata TaxID=48799 RepID=A0A915PIA9_9BILA
MKTAENISLKSSAGQKCQTARILTAFWIFGLCNNYGYVIMLSAAEDILEQQDHHNATDIEAKCLDKITTRHCSIMTTGTILLADILPCLFVKLSFPFFMQRIPFGIRHFLICSLQALSYLIVAFSSGVLMSLTGVVFASFSSGLGEITYLSLTPYFNKNTISTWSSGTGGAGVMGALVYAALTEPHLFNLSPKVTLLVMLVVPIIFSLAYWCLLVLPESIHQVSVMEPKTWIVPETRLSTTSFRDTSYTETIEKADEKSQQSTESVKQRLLSFREMLLTTYSLLRFMIPLMLVYFGEYLINQGIVQLIFYPCDKGWNLTRSSQYRWYQVLYQAGVFISRSSINIIQLPYWILVLLPVLQVEPDSREFALSISSLGDSFGIVAAGFASIPIFNYVCSTSLPQHVTA